VIGAVRDVSRFPGRHHFAACHGTAPIEVSSGPRKIYRLSRRGNRRLNHVIHMAAVTQIRYRHSDGRGCYDRKIAEGKTPKKPSARSGAASATRSSPACKPAPARPQARVKEARDGTRGTTPSPARPAHTPRRRLFGQATPGPSHHPRTLAAATAAKTCRQSQKALQNPLMTQRGIVMHGDEACATNSVSCAERAVLRGILNRFAWLGSWYGIEIVGALISTLIAREQEAHAHGWG
jgi:transposase IS116/IS110/IS902 family protein